MQMVIWGCLLQVSLLATLWKLTLLMLLSLCPWTSKGSLTKV